MIDWFRGEIEFLHCPLPSGQVMSISPDGEMEWVCAKRLDVRSSWESAIFLRSSGSAGYGMASHLLIDGNLAKFLQGHNLFGIRDLNRLLYLAFKKVLEIHDEHFDGWSAPDMALAKIKKGDYKVKMLDINQMFDCGNDLSVESWLHAAEMRARSRHGRATADHGTIYLGRHSRRWAFKFYNKFRELFSNTAKGSHRLPEPLENKGLEEFARGKLRAELRIFSKELEQLGITHGYHLTPDVIQSLFNSYLGRIDMSQQTTLIDENLLKLSAKLRGTYLLWKQGINLRDCMSRPTFYRQRQDFLALGIDIAIPPVSVESSNVIPLIRVIEAKPVEIPQWAYQHNLIAA